jgi:hypothetical protein
LVPSELSETPDVNTRALFGISVLMSLAAFGLVTGLYIYPRLKALPVARAVTALVSVHAYRFIGLAFLVPGVVSPSLPASFARPAAYGDLIAAVLAMVAALALRAQLLGALLLVWVFNVWGTADLLYAFAKGSRVLAEGGPGAFGAAFFIPTVGVPALLVTHALIFRLLLRPLTNPTGR